MDPILLNALVFGCLAAGIALAMPFGRRRGWVALGLAALGVAAGMVVGTLTPSDLWLLPGHLGLSSALLWVLGQVAFGVTAVAAGRPRLSGHPLVVAPLCGALLGEIAGAMVLASGVESPRERARLALAASAGGFIGRVGDPVWNLLPVVDGVGLWLMPVLALVGVLVAWPSRTGREAQDGDVRVTFVAAATALGVLIPQASSYMIWMGTAAMLIVALRSRGSRNRVDLNPLLWVVGSALLVMLATASGAPTVVGMGLEEMQNAFMALGPAALYAGGVAGAFLAGGHGAALFALSTIERALSLRIDGAALALAAGVAAGGVGPLIAVRALRAGLIRWAVQVVSVGILVLVVLRF